MPYIGRSTDGFGVRNRFLFVASANDTSVSGADANGATLTFTDGAYVDVYLNGVLLKAGTDYNTNTANTIAGLSALSANDEVTVVVYDIFSVADTVSASSGGTFSGGVTVGSTLDVTGNVSLDGGSFVFNESGADKDFRIESDNLDDAFFVEGSTGNIGLGTTSPNSIVSGNSHLDIRSGTYSFLEVGTTATTTSSDVGYLEFMNGNNTRLATVVGGADGANNDGYLRISTANGGSFTERMRIDHDGNIIANSDTSTAAVIYDDTSGNAGPILHSDHRIDATRNSTSLALNHTAGASGSFVDLRDRGSTVGTISHNASGTVAYNAFTGCHWGRLSDNSKPTILKGTILETIDEMCDWYEVEFTIPEVKYVDGDEKYLVPFADIGSKKVGDSFTFTYKDGVEYSGTLKLEDDEKHSKCKVSDTADSKKVYGVFFSWDGEDDGYNDMYVAGLGTYVIRVHKDVTVESGDLLVSNGDGTAKVQDDDIIRSKTIAKVLANVKQETYSDGSYTVPCALYCG